MGKSHFPIDLGIMNAIRQLVKPGSTILELGSGNGTNRLTEDFTVYSIEDNLNWVGYCKESNYIHAPLVKLNYNKEVIRENLPENYDLILIDGPAGKKGRTGFLANIDLFKLNVPIVIDDTLREHECTIARETAYVLNRPLYVFWNFSVIAPDILTRTQIARIQKIALEVLEKEEESYLSSYFSAVNQKISVDFKTLEKTITQEKERNLEYARLKANQRKLKSLENSVSLKLGRIMTAPFRIISGLLRRN